MSEEDRGEEAIKVALKHLRERFEHKKEIHFLEGDMYSYRRADFFLPKHNIYIEYLSGWDNPDTSERDVERARHQEKIDVYKRNDVRCIYIYPKDLPRVEQEIKAGIKSIEKTKHKLPFWLDHLHLTMFGALASIVLLSYATARNSLLFYIAGFLLVVMLILAVVVKSTRCPNCGRGFAKTKLRSVHLKDEQHTSVGQHGVKYMGDASIDDWTPRVNTVSVIKHVHKCKHCHYRWAVHEKVAHGDATTYIATAKH